MSTSEDLSDNEKTFECNDEEDLSDEEEVDHANMEFANDEYDGEKESDIEEDSYSEDKMTSDYESVKSAKALGSRVPKFRKDSEWGMFEHKFLAYAEDKNFVDVVERKHPLLPDQFDGDLTAVADKKGF
jgi:hypothetical protein